MNTDGKRAAAAEGVERGALCFDGEPSVRMFEECDCVSDIGVASFIDRVRAAASLKRKSALAGCRTKLFG